MMISIDTGTTVDAFTTEVVRSTAVAITRKMKTNLMRTAYSSVIYEAEDFTVGLFDTDGNTISIGLGLPMFIRGLSDAIKAKIAHWGKENIAPGDILLTNDGYVMGSHLNHMIFTLPIFHDGEIVAFSASMAHWPDVGGVLGGITRDIYAEGLQLPFVKIFKAGRQDPELTAIICANCRLPDRAMGDFRAQIAAIRTGERRVSRLLERYGAQAFTESIRLIFDQSERLARAAVRTIPDGVYEAESFMDDDGVDIGKPVPIKVRVEKKGDEMTIDLTEVSAQVRGFYNSGTTTGYSCAQVAYKCLTSPTDYPINEGSFRPLKVILAPGTVVSAVKPAAMRWWMTFPMTVVDTVFKAMEQAIPDRTIAAHHADLCVALINGISPKDGRLFLAGIGPSGGGFGAKLTEDGMSATVCLNDGDTHNHPVEQMEAKYPLLFERHALREDSGGAGRYRGGLGTEQVVQARAPININVQVDRVHCAPWGLAGGRSGAGNQVCLRIGGKEIADLPNAKVLMKRLAPGDAISLRAGGGGGFGPPEERDPEKVAHDVRQGYVSRDIAREIYRVALDAAGNVDRKGTELLRRE